MPTRPRGRCTQPGCTAISVARGRCPDHPREAWARAPGSPRAGMRTSFERALRARVLREEPVCRRCRRAPSAEVDHILAIAAGGARAVRANLQALCAPCHLVKTGEDRAALRAART